jgi:hypothetical protein
MRVLRPAFVLGALLGALLLGSPASAIAAPKSANPFAGRYVGVGSYWGVPTYYGDFRIRNNGAVDGSYTYSLFPDDGAMDPVTSVSQDYGGQVSPDGTSTIVVTSTAHYASGAKFTSSSTSVGVATLDPAGDVHFTGVIASGPHAGETTSFVWHRL